MQIISDVDMLLHVYKHSKQQCKFMLMRIIDKSLKSNNFELGL